MGKIVFLVAIFVFGFILGAGVGFKILEGVSGDIVMQAVNNSYSGFNQALPGSALGNKLDQVKAEVKANISAGLKSYINEKVNSIFSK